MIGIIGFGRFGELVAGYLARDFEVRVYNRSDKSRAIMESGARAASLADVCRQKIVILCVPISTLPAMLDEIGPLLQAGGLVIDVCSVKERPVKWMQSALPREVSILATHPMFGPDSAADSLVGRKIVLCQERLDDSRYANIKTYLESKGLVVIETSPAEHDRQIAVSLSLAHFIGRSLSEFGARELEIDTEGYKRLLHILGVVEHDSWQLFADMNRYNRFAKKNRADFIAAVLRVDQRLD